MSRHLNLKHPFVDPDWAEVALMWRVSGAESEGPPNGFLKGCVKPPGGEGEAVSNSAQLL